VLRAAGLRIKGIIFNHTTPADPADHMVESDNPQTVAKFGKVPVLGGLRYLGPDPNWRFFAEDCPGLEELSGKTGNERESART